MAKSKDPSEQELISNRISLALNQKQQFLKSLGLTSTYNGEASVESKDAEDEVGEEDVLERVGVGAVVGLNDGLPARNENNELDKLLVQIFGKKAADSHLKMKKDDTATKTKIPEIVRDDDISDREGGKSAAIKSSKAAHRHKKKAGTREHSDTNMDDKTMKSDKSTTKRKKNSFLDEMLSKKKSKNIK